MSAGPGVPLRPLPRHSLPGRSAAAQWPLPPDRVSAGPGISQWPIRDTTPQCPQGQEFRNGRCRDVVRQCPQGQILRNGRCVPVLLACPFGEILVNGRCVKIQAPQPDCRGDLVFRNGRCRCPRGLVESSPGKCTKPPSQTQPPTQGNPNRTNPGQCRPGETFINGRCVRIQLQIPNFGTIEIQ